MIEIRISQNNIPAFSHLIPDIFHPSIKTEEIFGIGLWDVAYDAPMGVLLIRESNEWMEIVWVAIDKAYQGLYLPEYLISNAIARAKDRNILWGAFATLPNEEKNTYFKRLFETIGFSFTEETSPVFVVELGTIAKNETLLKIEKSSHKAPVLLQDADESIQNEVLMAVHHDSRVIPLPQKPDWSSYEQQISSFYIIGDTPKGLLLFTKMGNDLVISCAWETSPVALSCMIAAAMQNARALYPPDTNIVIPAINDASLHLVQKLLPEAKMLKTEQARLYFTTFEEVSSV